MIGHTMFILSSIIFILILGLWIITEIFLLKEIRQKNGEDSIWLAINILLPVIGYILYKLSHIKEEKSQN